MILPKGIKPFECLTPWCILVIFGKLNEKVLYDWDGEQSTLKELKDFYQTNYTLDEDHVGLFKFRNLEVVIPKCELVIAVPGNMRNPSKYRCLKCGKVTFDSGDTQNCRGISPPSQSLPNTPKSPDKG